MINKATGTNSKKILRSFSSETRQAASPIQKWIMNVILIWFKIVSLAFNDLIPASFLLHEANPILPPRWNFCWLCLLNDHYSSKKLKFTLKFGVGNFKLLVNENPHWNFFSDIFLIPLFCTWLFGFFLARFDICFIARAFYVSPIHHSPKISL